MHSSYVAVVIIIVMANGSRKNSSRAVVVIDGAFQELPHTDQEEGFSGNGNPSLNRVLIFLPWLDKTSRPSLTNDDAR